MTDSDTHQATGQRFLTAFANRDFAQIEACFHPEARFRALIPPGVREAADAIEATNHLREWFGGADHFELLSSEVGSVVDRLHVTYRLRLHDADGWQLVEQQAYCWVQDGRIVAMDLLCSGFRPEHVPANGTYGNGQSAPAEVAAVLHGGEANCSTLTPLIKTKLRELDGGQVLEVITSEPSAELDIASWSNLTGNPLLATRNDGAQKHFYVRKK